VKKKWKIILPLLALAGAGTAGLISYRVKQAAIVAVQSGRVARQDLAAIVTASGEIKPRNYINIGTSAMAPSRITEILVLEGQRVRKGQMLAKLESVQPEAEVAAQQASVRSAEADAAAAEAAVKAADENSRTGQAAIERAKAELQKARTVWERAQRLEKEQLISKQEFDQRLAEFDSYGAAVREAEARLSQLRAGREQALSLQMAAQRRIALANANLKRTQDMLDRTRAVAPLDGVVTNLPVRVGETVVPGVQNSQASLIMTIADMSLITAEVKVDETDIVNVKLDQIADVTIDAIPNRTFKGKVIEIGNTAILRSTGVAASQSAISSQEAKDFKVVVALENPPDEIRPGLSCTAKVTTATRAKALTIPIQALTVRQRGDLEPKQDGKVEAAAKAPNPAEEKRRKEEIQGVFVIKGEKAEFRKVDTGITGATDIEVLTGLNESEEIITGSYKIIRTLRNDAKIKVDNKASVKAES